MRIAIAAPREDAEALERTVRLNPEHVVHWRATAGAKAVLKCAASPVDLVLVALSLEDMDGGEATRRLIAAGRCAVLVVSRNMRSDAARILAAMGQGAFDAADMPVYDSGGPGPAATALLVKIATISRLLGAPQGAGTSPPLSGPARSGSRDPELLVAIGASAGGPAALVRVLGRLPRAFPAAIVVVQHVDQSLASGMAAWLGQQCQLSVRVAAEGDRPTAGMILLAGTDDHLVLKTRHSLGYTAEPWDNVYRPSVDVFFDSVSRRWCGQAVGVLLTGMGRDGALGLNALRAQGRHTIAQDEATSAIYGMPKAAAQLGAAVDVLPIDGIATRLMFLFGGHAHDR